MLAICLVGAAPARSAPFVYVANGDSVLQYDAMGGALSPLSPATVAAGSDALEVAVSPDGKSVYVSNNAGPTGNSVFQYDVGTGGGLTPKIPATVGSLNDPLGIAVSPDGRSAYVANNLSTTVAQFDVGAGGVLTPKTPATVATASHPFKVAVSPDGKSVYVTNFTQSRPSGPPSANSVSQFDVGAGGVLSPKTPAAVATGPGPFGVAVSPDSKSVYVTDSNDSTVSQYDVGAGGALTAKVPATVATGSFPNGIAISPDGKSVYVPNFFNVSQYDVGAGGALTAKTPATVAAGLAQDVAVSPDGKSAYVTNSGARTVSQYDIDPLTGALSPKSPATVAAEFAHGIAIGPPPANDATSTAASCSPNTFAPGDATVCTAMVTDTATSGRTTPTGTVSFTSSGAGSFGGSPCTLSGNGASASCAVFFTSFPRSGHLVTASYGGDATHIGSAGGTLVLVAVPESTEGCVVFGHGRITAANGDRASFRGLVVASPPRGAELFRDNGPANPMRVRSSSVDAVTCNADATRASVFGKASIDAAGSLEYRIDIQLAAGKGGMDSYRVRLSSGYDSGAQPIRHGDVDIRLSGSEQRHHDANAERGQTGDHQDGG